MRQPSAKIKRRRAEYLNSHGSCEFSTAFLVAGVSPLWLTKQGWSLSLEVEATEVDHLFGRQGDEDDVEHPSNYVAANWLVHNWKTDHDKLGRILAIWWKHSKRFDEPDGWQPELMSRVFGQNILGWLENQLDDSVVPEVFRELIREVIEMEKS